MLFVVAADLAHALGEVRARALAQEAAASVAGGVDAAQLAQGRGPRDLALLFKESAGETPAVGVEGVEGLVVAACGEGRLGALERGDLFGAQRGAVGRAAPRGRCGARGFGAG
ncbi:hypothetical protein [Nannocystis pusilla]|uniref:hypothetical protein n=1 Tax=Nannocystis pusilla TaxID=889268 RepID=UPI003B824984